MLPASCDIAFKEWASVCRALADGRQTIILRKGGIDEGREGFRVVHRHFWLFPTRFHQSPSELSAAGAGYLASESPDSLDGTKIALKLLAQVEQVEWMASEEKLSQLGHFHIWSDSTVRERFHYKRPGLFLLLVRVFRCDAHSITNAPEFAGCKSWVPLQESLSTGNAQPALGDAEFAAQRDQLRAAIS